MGVKQHLMGLQWIGPQQKDPAVRQLDMRHLQLGPLAAQNGKVLAPVELESLARLKDQWHKCSAPRCLLLLLPICPPSPGKSCYTTVGTGVTQLHQILMQLLRRPPLLARLPGLGLQPTRQLRRKRIKLARTFGNAELRFHRARPQIPSNGIARQLRPPRDLPNGQMLTQCPTAHAMPNAE